MKKIRNSLLIFLFIILMTINVKAANFNYYLSNGDSNYDYIEKSNAKMKNIQRGDTVYVTAIIDNKDNLTNYRLDDGKLTIRWDSKVFELQEVDGKPYNDSVSDLAGLTIKNINKVPNKFTIGHISATGYFKAGKNKIVEYKFMVLKDAKAGSTTIYQMDGEDQIKCFNANEEKNEECGENLLSELQYNIEKSKVNKLSSVKINGQELEYFSEDKNDYDITVESNVSKVNISVTKKDSKSTISGNYGDNTIKYGENKLVVNVISESGERNVYNFNITRNDSRSSVNTLKTLTISNGELDFSPNITEYTVNVSNDIDKVTITSSLNDTKSKYEVDYQNKEIELIEGSNKVEIKVTSEKGETKTYTININRALSSNNSLKSLKVNDEKIKLEEAIFTYDLEVENDVEEVIIKAETNDAKATIDLQEKYPLEIGENEINIVVTAASGEKASYMLNITRKKLLSKDSLLTSLKIKGYDIDFKQNVTLYNLKIKESDNELEITTTQEDPNATVEIEGNKDLENGSIIKINVKAEDGSYTRYFINIEKGSSGIPIFVIILIVLFILLGLCIGIIFYRKKKKEQREFDKLDEAKEEVKIENNINEEENNDSESFDDNEEKSPLEYQKEEIDEDKIIDNIVDKVNEEVNEDTITSELNDVVAMIGKHEGRIVDGLEKAGVEPKNIENNQNKDVE